MTNSYVLVKKNELNEIVECAGPCIEAEVKSLLTDPHNEDKDFELMDETLFSINFPLRYKELIEADLVAAIGTWIDKAYDCEKLYSVDGVTLFSDTFMISVYKNTLYISFYIQCPPTEAACLILLLKEHLNDEFEISVACVDIYSEPIFLN